MYRALPLALKLNAPELSAPTTKTPERTPVGAAADGFAAAMQRESRSRERGSPRLALQAAPVQLQAVAAPPPARPPGQPMPPQQRSTEPPPTAEPGPAGTPEASRPAPPSGRTGGDPGSGPTADAAGERPTEGSARPDRNSSDDTAEPGQDTPPRPARHTGPARPGKAADATGTGMPRRSVQGSTDSHPADVAGRWHDGPDGPGQSTETATDLLAQTTPAALLPPGALPGPDGRPHSDLAGSAALAAPPDGLLSAAMLAAHGLGAATGLPGAAPAGSAGPLRVAGAAGAAARSGRGGPAGAAAGPDDLAAAQRPGAGFMASGPGTAAALGSVPLVPGPAMAAEPVLAGAAARAQRAEGAGTGAPDPLPPGGLPMAAADGLATPAAGSTGAVPVAGLDLPTGPANMASPAGAGFTAGVAAGAAAGLATPAGLPGTEPAAAAARDGGPAGATGLPQAMGVGPAPAPGQAVGARPVAEARVAVPLTDPGFASALGAQVSLLARGGVHEARLQLHPAEMGPIAVQISLDGVTARVHFQADLATTREVIEASLPALAGALRESGLTLTGGGVSQQTQQQGQQQGQPQGQPGQQPGRAPGADTADGLGRAADAAAAHRGHPGQPRGLVDLVA